MVTAKMKRTRRMENELDLSNLNLFARTNLDARVTNRGFGGNNVSTYYIS